MRENPYALEAVEVLLELGVSATEINSHYEMPKLQDTDETPEMDTRYDLVSFIVTNYIGQAITVGSRNLWKHMQVQCIISLKER